MAKNQYKKEPLKNNVEEMFIGPFGSSLKNECFVDEEDAYCMVYEQKHAIQKTLDGKNRFVDKNKYYELKRFTIKPGDIIVSCRGTIGETFIVPENAPLGIMHPSIMKIRLKPNVYNIEYFNLLLKNRLKDYNKSANGSGIKMAISATELGKELFPIPPMDEQQKTSKIFLMVNHLILLRKQQLAKLDELVKARFVEMFGDFEVNPKEFPVYHLCELCDVGSSKRIYQEEQSISGIPFLKVADLNELIDTGKYLCSTFIPLERYEQLLHKELTPKENDILITSRGTLGKCYIVQSDDEFYFQDGMISWLSNLSPKVSSIYISYLFAQPYIQKQIESLQAGSTVAYLSIAMLKKMNVILPPKKLQDDFATFVEHVDQQKQTVQQSLEKLELMKKALMQEYFG